MHATFTPIAGGQSSAVAAPARPQGTATDASFADLLQRGQATHGLLARPFPAANPAEARPAADADRERDDRTPTEAEQARRNATAKAAAKAAARPREKERPAAPTARTTLAGDEAAAPGSVSKPAVATDDRPVAAALPGDETRATLAQLTGSTRVSGDGDAFDDAGVPAPSGGFGGPATNATDAADSRADDVRSAADETRLATLDAGAETPPAPDLATLATLATTERKPVRPGSASEVGSAMPAGTAALSGRLQEASTTPPVALPAPVQSAEFAGQLAAQVSVWVGDGVQQAELHLNPADLGPISVQIQIEDAQAHVAFAADAAPTREAIERGLPALAAALREQGLTLSGGGVFQQPPGTRDDAGPSTAGPTRRTLRGIDAAAAPPGARALSLNALPGRLDVYA